MMGRTERKQAISFQDSIGELVDEYLRAGMEIKLMKEVLEDEAKNLYVRKRELDEDGL